MAEINGGDLTIFGMFGSISLSFMAYHTYKFDKCRCLLPKRKEWFRVLLTWMLLLSNVTFCIWAWTWAYVKYQLGWVMMTGLGARPWPSARFPPAYAKLNTPLMVCLTICYSLQASLNAQEGLYWYHLMRAVRHPAAATPWLKSWYFYAWIGISLVSAAVQLAVPWAGHQGDMRVQLAKDLLTGGVLEFVVLVASTIVVAKFPRFLSDVQASGVSPQVRTRLHFYHEANKVRTFFRSTFTIPLLILGSDGLTTAARINLNPLASDVLATIASGSLTVVFMISVMLYLPRSSATAKERERVRGRVMVSSHQQHSGGTNHGDRRGGGIGSGGASTGEFALMSLLREGGQWEYDNDLATTRAHGGNGGKARGGAKIHVEETGREASRTVTLTEQGTMIRNIAPFAGASSFAPVPRDNDKQWGRERLAPYPLQNFTSPIAIEQRTSLGQRPVEIRMLVEREVRQD